VGDVVVAGTGIHPFGRFETPLAEMGAHAAREALDDAGVSVNDVDMVFVANVGASMAKGQQMLELVGRPGVPVVNVEAACASSGAALYLGSRMIASGAASTVLCVGMEKAPRGFIAASGYESWQLDSGLGVNPVYFALDAQALITGSGATVEDLADVSVKNHANAVHNPNAMYRRPVTREEVLGSRAVCPPLTLLMLCAPNEGAAAAVLMSRAAAARRGVDAAVSLLGVSLASRRADDWFVPAPSYSAPRRSSITAHAVADALAEASVGIGDVDVVECQDTDSASELIAYSELGLCAPGDEAGLLRDGVTAMGGRLPVNPSGGLLSKGEPLGASGLGQVYELVAQLRGRCGPRQVSGARIGLGHVKGAGHNASVVILGAA
jgi:acetyl-CoA acetyltransferase